MLHCSFIYIFLYYRDGVPYCEADYHAQYGVKCETCSRYISGRVLEVRTGPDFNIRFLLAEIWPHRNTAAALKSKLRVDSGN